MLERLSKVFRCVPFWLTVKWLSGRLKQQKTPYGRWASGSTIDVLNDVSNPIQKGSSIVLWAETTTGLILGSDAIGELRKMAEAVGKEAAQTLLTELVAKPTVDVFLADMLIPYMALAQGKSSMLVRTVSEHIESNIWLMEEMLKVKFRIEKANNLYRIEKS